MPLWVSFGEVGGGDDRGTLRSCSGSADPNFAVDRPLDAVSL